MEIITKDIMRPRLTVAKDRVTIKLPKFLGQAEREAVIAKATELAAGLRAGGMAKTHRGKFKLRDGHWVFKGWDEGPLFPRRVSKP